MSKLKLEADKWTLQYFLEAVGQHYAQAWMADYDANEVGKYLIDKDYVIVQTGSYQVDIETDMTWKATRAEFLIWRLTTYKDKER